MTYLLITVLAIVSGLILTWGLRQRERYLQFPILAAAVFLGWLMPQFLGLRNDYSLPSGGLDKTVLMAIFCLGAVYWGYVINSKPAKQFQWNFNRKRLLQGSATLSLVGAFFFFKVGQLAVEATAQTGGAWTGIITIYYFFSSMLSVGFAIALILHLQRPSLGTWSILIFGFIFYFERILIAGRRADTVELFLMVVYAIWFSRRWAPPRSLIIGAFLVGTLFINSAGDYRATMLGEDRTNWSGAGVESALAIDYFGNLTRIAEGNGAAEEVRNAVFTIEAVDRRLRFDYGFSLWNGFLHNYVPKQFVGADFRSALTIELEDDAYAEFGYIPWPGTTPTGLTDGFSSFWYFGAVKFFLIGFILSRWYRAANEGNFVAQLVIMLSMGAALHAITHTTHHFFLVFIKLAAFTVPVLLYARVRRHSNNQTGVPPLRDILARNAKV